MRSPSPRGISVPGCPTTASISTRPLDTSVIANTTIGGRHGACFEPDTAGVMPGHACRGDVGARPLCDLFDCGGAFRTRLPRRGPSAKIAPHRDRPHRRWARSRVPCAPMGCLAAHVANHGRSIGVRGTRQRRRRTNRAQRPTRQEPCGEPPDETNPDRAPTGFIIRPPCATRVSTRRGPALMLVGGDPSPSWGSLACLDERPLDSRSRRLSNPAFRERLGIPPSSRLFG